MIVASDFIKRNISSDFIFLELFLDDSYGVKYAFKSDIKPNKKEKIKLLNQAIKRLKHKIKNNLKYCELSVTRCRNLTNNSRLLELALEIKLGVIK